MKCLCCGLWFPKSKGREIVVQWTKELEKEEFVGWQINPLPQRIKPLFDEEKILLKPDRKGLVCDACFKFYPSMRHVRIGERRFYGGMRTVPVRNAKGEPVLAYKGDDRPACAFDSFYKGEAPPPTPVAPTVPKGMFMRGSILAYKPRKRSKKVERIRLVEKLTHSLWVVEAIDRPAAIKLSLEEGMMSLPPR